jgi:hypothetical protein
MNKKALPLGKGWDGPLSGKRDSNPRHQPWQGCALPTELFPHNQFFKNSNSGNKYNIGVLSNQISLDKKKVRHLPDSELRTKKKLNEIT